MSQFLEFLRYRLPPVSNKTTAAIRRLLRYTCKDWSHATWLILTLYIGKLTPTWLILTLYIGKLTPTWLILTLYIGNLIASTTVKLTSRLLVSFSGMKFGTCLHLEKGILDQLFILGHSLYFALYLPHKFSKRFLTVSIFLRRWHKPSLSFLV